jgi:predicted transcriptional regulator
MKKNLLDVLFLSEKRKMVLLLLRDGARETEYLLKSLDTTRQALLPQIKILEEHYLVDHYDDIYELTTVGKIIVNYMVPLLDTLDTFDTDIDYWSTHEIDFIPSELLKRMGELKDCDIVSPSLTDIFSFHSLFHVNNKMPDSVYTVTAFLYPEFDSLLREMLENNISSYFIFSQELLDKIITEHHTEFETLLKNDNFKMYVYNKDTKVLFFTFDDTHLLMSLLRTNGEVDNKYILCTSREALEWAKDLFEYYLENSTPITKI